MVTNTREADLFDRSPVYEEKIANLSTRDRTDGARCGWH
jgi:hypothetical protein